MTDSTTETSRPLTQLDLMAAQAITYASTDEIASELARRLIAGSGGELKNCSDDLVVAALTERLASLGMLLTQFTNAKISSENAMSILPQLETNGYEV
jgi:hypothetical protein